MKFQILLIYLSISFFAGCTDINPQTADAQTKTDSIQYDSLYVDPRDGKSYRTTVVNGKLWMLDNLAYALEQSLLDPDNKNSRYYNQHQAMQACPPGWQLPSKHDIEFLSEQNINIKNQLNIELYGYYNQSLDTLVFKNLQAGFWTKSATMLYSRHNIQNHKGEDSIVGLNVNLRYKRRNVIYEQEEYLPDFTDSKSNKSLEQYQLEWEFGLKNEKPILYDYMVVDSLGCRVETPQPWIYLNCRCITDVD